MKRKLENYEPKNVLFFFEEICNIPHVSHHTELISRYCETFAKQRNLRFYRDDAGNVVIYKNASPGYEEHKTVILQGHMDMVGAKTEDSGHNFLTDPIDICEEVLEDGFITANKTTLGGDDGIAVAYMLAILDDNRLKHPALEAVFTVDEEVGLLGANALDTSVLSGGYMLNLDSEKEGEFLTGCAGGLRSNVILDGECESYSGDAFVITIANLKGGHSGSEIGTGRPSANALMGRVLDNIRKLHEFRLISLEGGVVDNAICTKSTAVIAMPGPEQDRLCRLCETVTKDLRNEYAGIDEGITVSCEPYSSDGAQAVSVCDTDRMVFLMRHMPYGVTARSAADVKLVETSLNPGILRLDCGRFMIGYSVRSSMPSAKRDLADRLKSLAGFAGGHCEESGDYPAWPRKKESELCEIIDGLYRRMYGAAPRFATIHAGLECGIFADRMPDLDIISYGPDMYDIHTFDERLSIQSVKRVYEFTVKLLECL